MPPASTPPTFPKLAGAIAETGASLTQVGQRVGVNPQYLSQIIRGRQHPSSALRARIAEALGRPEAELFAEVTP